MIETGSEFPLLLRMLSFAIAGRERGREDSLDVVEGQSCLEYFIPRPCRMVFEVGEP